MVVDAGDRYKDLLVYNPKGKQKYPLNAFITLSEKEKVFTIPLSFGKLGSYITFYLRLIVTNGQAQVVRQ